MWFTILYISGLALSHVVIAHAFPKFSWFDKIVLAVIWPLVGVAFVLMYLYMFAQTISNLADKVVALILGLFTKEKRE